jgi:F0F1-type ATP synthase gamma subunit
MLTRVLAAIKGRVEPTSHPLLAVRPVTKELILIFSTDKGLCGPLNANLFKLVLDIKTPAKYVAVGRKGAQFLARNTDAGVGHTERDPVAGSDQRARDVHYHVTLTRELPSIA